MKRPSQRLVKEILEQLASTPESLRGGALRLAIADHGARLGERGIQKLVQLAAHIERAQELFPEQNLKEQIQDPSHGSS